MPFISSKKAFVSGALAFFFFPVFSFFCGFLARIGKFVKKKKTGYSVFLGVVFPKDWQEKPFYLLHWLFFLFFFYFFWVASMREFSRKKEKKKLAIGVFFCLMTDFGFSKIHQIGGTPNNFFSHLEIKHPSHMVLTINGLLS